MPRTARIKRLGIWTTAIAAALWLTSFVINMTYHGDRITSAFGTGYAAIYWGSDAETRNSRILNNFDWPWFPRRGVGLGWDESRRWANHGPSVMLSAWTLQRYVEFPKRTGIFWLPSFDAGSARNIGHLGLPFNIPFLLGLILFTISVLHQRRQWPESHCHNCGYDLTGAPTDLCPECGKVNQTEQTK